MSKLRFHMMIGDVSIEMSPQETCHQLDMLLLGMRLLNAAVFSVSSTSATPLSALHDEFLKDITKRGLKFFPVLGSLDNQLIEENESKTPGWVLILGLEPVAAFTLGKRYQKKQVLVYKYGHTLENLHVEIDH